MLHRWNALQEDGTAAEHLEGDQRQGEGITFPLISPSSPPLLLSPSPPFPLSLLSPLPLPPLLPRNKSVTKSAHFLHLQHHLLPQPPRAKCVSSSDALVVEDSSQRIDLSRDIPAQELVTGEQCTRRDRYINIWDMYNYNIIQLNSIQGFFLLKING